MLDVVDEARGTFRSWSMEVEGKGEGAQSAENLARSTSQTCPAVPWLGQYTDFCMLDFDG